MEEKIHRSGIQIILRACNVSLGGFFFGYCIGVLNFSQPTLNLVLDIASDQQSFWNGLISAFMAFGALIGCVFTPFLLSRVSRRDALIFCDILGMLGSALSQFTNLPMFCIHRFVVGIATGMNSTIVPLYLKEFSPVSFSGITGSINGFNINFGILISYFFGLGFGFDDKPTTYTNFWRFVFLFPIITCFIRTFVFIFFYTEESPLYLIQQSRQVESKAILNKIYKQEYVDQVYNDIVAEEESNKKCASSFSDLLKPGIRKRLYIGVMLQLLQQFSGINAVNFYSGTIFQNATGSATLAFWLSIAVSAEQIAMALVTGLLTKVTGRKTLFLAGDGICIVTLALLGVGSLLQQYYYPNNNGVQALIIVMIYGYCLGYGISLGPVVWLYNAEILPAKGQSITTIANWSGVICITFLFPICKNAFNMYPIFFFFSLYTLVNMYLLMFQLKETRGLTSIQIEQAYSENVQDENQGKQVNINVTQVSETENQNSTLLQKIKY